ncbi:plasmid partitioning protein RepB [Paracoccus sp. ME4]|uniref:plasmid partitioning protein RepB n=1 Tax=Paracoccus sp. ME4 TaxID=3138066 RepID=UPI00398AFE23
MAKKPNMFGSVMEEMLKEDAVRNASKASPPSGKGATGAREAAESAQQTVARPDVPAPFRRGAVGALAAELRNSAPSGLRDIDPDLIDASPYSDRMAFGEDDIRDLAESIRKHGLRVPILLRPNPDAAGRFIIVYGRRRLAALRLLGFQARALVRTMDEEEAILVQGQENNDRLDPSFIEKALFAASLEEAGYSTDVLAEALCVSKPYLSHMRRVVTNVDRRVLETIGPCHGVGWKRWHDAVERIVKAGIEAPCPAPDYFTPDMDGMARFEAWLDLIRDGTSQGTQAGTTGKDNTQAIDSNRKSVKVPVFSSHNGKRIGDIRKSGGRVFLSAEPRETEFARWLESNGTKLLERLHAEWAASTKADD